MTIKRERALSDFIDAWNAGRRPEVDTCLARVDAAERDALADEIATFLTWAPDPDYDEAALGAIAAEPVVRAAREASTQAGGLWPVLLPRLRERAALTTAQLAGEVAEGLGLPIGSAAKAEHYLDELEAGTLDGSRLSRRLRDALARALDVGPDLLAGAAAAMRSPAPGTAPLFRADADAGEDIHEDLELLADALSTGPTPEWDEVDALFRGG